MSAGFKTFTLVQAPGVSTVERKVLEHHYRQTILDPEYVLVINYELRIDIIGKNAKDKIIITAPGVYERELVNLRKRIKDALASNEPENQFVIVNYACMITVIPPYIKTDGIQTYGEISQKTEPDISEQGNKNE